MRLLPQSRLHITEPQQTQSYVQPNSTRKTSRHACISRHVPFSVFHQSRSRQRWSLSMNGRKADSEKIVSTGNYPEDFIRQSPFYCNLLPSTHDSWDLHYSFLWAHNTNCLHLFYVHKVRQHSLSCLGREILCCTDLCCWQESCGNTLDSHVWIH